MKSASRRRMYAVRENGADVDTVVPTRRRAAELAVASLEGTGHALTPDQRRDLGMWVEGRTRSFGVVLIADGGELLVWTPIHSVDVEVP